MNFVEQVLLKFLWPTDLKDFVRNDRAFCELLAFFNKITLEYPKGTGRMWTFPEIDRVEMLSPEDAKRKLKEEQRPFVDRLMKLLKKTTAE